MIIPFAYLPLMHLSTLVEIAADLRRRSGRKEPPYSSYEIVEASFPGTLVTGCILPDGVDELVSRRPEGPVIIYSRTLPGPGQRFVIGHALAHLLFDNEQVCARAGSAGCPHSEGRADFFSAELFVPLVDLRPRVKHWPSDDLEDQEIYLDHVDRIASAFAMPAAVIDSQIRRLATVDGIVIQSG